MNDVVNNCEMKNQTIRSLLDKGHYNKAFEEAQKLSKIYLQNKSWREYIICRGMIGESLWRLGLLDESIKQSKATILKGQKLNLPNEVFLPNNFNNIAGSYYLKSNVYKARHFYDLALSNSLIYLGKNHLDTALIYNNMTGTLMKIGETEKAIEYVKKSLDILDGIYKEENKNHISRYINIGICYLKLKDFTKAVYYQEKAFNLSTELYGSSHPYTASCLSHLGDICFRRNEFDKAKEFFLKSLDIRLNFFDKVHPLISYLYRRIALCYEELNDYDNAISNIMYSLKSNLLSYNVDNVYVNPSPEKEVFLSASEFLDTMFYKIYILKKFSSYFNLQAALFTSQVFLRWIIKIRKSYLYDDNKFFLANYSFPFFSKGIEIALQAQKLLIEDSNKWHIATEKFASINKDHFIIGSRYCRTIDSCLELALEFAEQSKAMVLLGNLKDEDAKFSAQIPEKLLAQEYDLKIEINYLIKRINQEQYKKEEEQDKQQLSEWQSKRFDQEQEYNKFISSLEKDYPAYYNIKYNHETVKLTEVQGILKHGQALIEYVIGEDELFIFCITKKEYVVKSVELPENLSDQVKDFLEYVEDSDRGDYINQAYQFYETLLAPIEELLQGINELIIVPDGELSLLPFEALLTEDIDSRTAFSDLPYLLLDYEISYHYSATLWHKGVQLSNQGFSIPDSFIGFAPVYSEDDKDQRAEFTENSVRSVDIDGEVYPALEHTEREVKNIQKQFQNKNIQAEIKLNKDASVDALMALVPNYKYVLIAGHAFFDKNRPERSGIILSPPSGAKKSQKGFAKTQERDFDILDLEEEKDTILYTFDAYHLKLNSDLVVLSCCETGKGKLQKGEGLMGINRGFLYSGARNIIYTLFKVYDDKSAQLTEELFGHILAGKSYKQALREAKLTLLKQMGNDPKTWAGFVLIGN